MKLLRIFLVVVLVATSAQSRLPTLVERLRELLAFGRGVVNQHIVNLLEGQRVNFPCGWPSLGIPPLDPFYIAELDMNLDTIGTLSSVDFRVFDANVIGLQHFEFENFELRILRPSLEFEIFLKQLTIDGQHSTRASLAGIPVNGEGSMVLTFNNVRVKGTIAINTINGGFLNVKTFLLGLNVGSASVTLRGFGAFLDPTISLAFSLALPTLINEGQETINDLIEEQILPSLNSVLNQYKFIDLIVAIISSLRNPIENEISELSNCFPEDLSLISYQKTIEI